MQSNVLTYFENGAARYHPDKVAISDGQVQTTFSELQFRAKNLATRLIGFADVLNQPMAVYLPKSTSVIVANLAILYSGNFYMNLDTKIPQQRLRNILVNIGPRLVITSRTYLDHLLASDANLRLDQIVLIEDLAQGERSGGFDNLSGRFAQVLDTDPVCIINTSGSTGTPKEWF